ncbi:MAG TPA: hypothetical protein PLM33_05115 [Acidobacteriota bacterium]|nr:hypothetical protein [Acidobacteriota bacterium]HRR26161.1 hypothetical protein [Acidobacteriota bacterium]HRV07650.1 hypothetical protein [Acidobacteriota bacterium]
MNDSMELPEKEREELIREENRRLRRLRLETDLLVAVLYQDPRLDLSKARDLVRGFRSKVVRAFPGKDATFDLVLLPRFDRVLKERWGKGFDSDIH